MITSIPKALTKHISCECKCTFDGKKCNSNQWWNNDQYWSDCKKKSCMWKKIMLGILLHVIVKMENI